MRIIQRSLLSLSWWQSWCVVRWCRCCGFCGVGEGLWAPPPWAGAEQVWGSPILLSVLGRDWSELPASLVPHFLIVALTVSVPLLGTHVQFPAEFCQQIWKCYPLILLCAMGIWSFLSWMDLGGRWAVRGAGTTGVETASLWEWAAGFECMQSPAPQHGHKYWLSLREEMVEFIRKGGWRWWAG